MGAFGPLSLMMYPEIQQAYAEFEQEIHRITATYQAQLQQAQLNFQNRLLKLTYGIDVNAEQPTQTEVEFALDLEIYDEQVDA